MSDIWRKLASQPVDLVSKLWILLEEELIKAERFSSSTASVPGGSNSGSRRTSAKVKIIDSRFLAIIGAAREMCAQIDAAVLIERLPETLSQYLTIWTQLLDSVLPVNLAGSGRASNLTPSIVMAELIKIYLTRTKLVVCAKKASLLPNSIKMDRITTKEVCSGLKTVIESLASENLATMQAVVSSILADINKNGLNNWEADLCKISILSDSITILTKTIKNSDSLSEETLKSSKELLTAVLDRITLICRNKKSHSTLKLITLNGLGDMSLPETCQDYGSRSIGDIILSLIELFTELLNNNESDDMILAETLKSAQRLLLNAPESFLLGLQTQEKLLTICRLFSTRANSRTRKCALELVSQLALIPDGAVKADLVGTLFSVLLSLADQDEQVRIAAQLVLVNIIPYLSDSCAELITRHCGANTRLHTGEFTAEFVSRLAQTSDSSVVLSLFTAAEGSLCSSSRHARCQTSTVVGALAKSFPDRDQLKDPVARLIPMLKRSLRDEVPENRARAAEALSFVHSIQP